MFQANLFCKGGLIKKRLLCWNIICQGAAHKELTAGDFYLFPTPSHSTKKKDSCGKVLTHS